MEIDKKYKIRIATLTDIPLFVFHHTLMFKEIMELKKKEVPLDNYIKMEKAHLLKLENEIPIGLCLCWLIEYMDQVVVASGGLSICSFTANLEIPNSKRAYVHSIYTVKEHRGKKLSVHILNEMITFCKNSNIFQIILNASDAGKPIYETLGFQASTKFMNLTLPYIE